MLVERALAADAWRWASPLHDSTFVLNLQITNVKLHDYRLEK
jgi:hypothetical protein